MADAPGDRPGRAMPAEPAANNRSDAASIIAAWIDSQTDRQRAILATRLVGLGSRTLDDLGHEFGVSRQRVNQLENQLVAVVRALRDTDEVWGPVRWTIRELRQRLGGFAPLTDDALPPDPAGSLVTRTLLWLAGYRVTPAAVVSMGFALPEKDELPLLGGGPAIDVMALAKDLHRRGAALHLLNQAMLAIDGVRRVDGRLVLWPRGLVDQAVTVLTVRGRPMTTDELDEVIGRDISTDSFRNRLLVDPRICRATRANVALRSWGRQEYTSIADLMCRRLQTGAMPLNSLAAELHRDFEISVESVHSFSRAPAFVVRAGQIMLRPADQPYVPAAPPGRVSGLFSIGTDVLVWRLQVGPDLFRGSGRAMPVQIAMFLALSPGDRRVLANEHGDVLASWSPHSSTGPSIGSLRAQAKALAASDGALLLVVFDRRLNSIVVQRVPDPPAGETALNAIARLTGLPPGSGLAELAAAVHADIDHVGAALRQRGDTELAAAVEALIAVEG